MNEISCWFSHLSAWWERANLLQHCSSLFIQTVSSPSLPSRFSRSLSHLPLSSFWSYILFPGPAQSGAGEEPVAEPEEEEEMLQHLLCFLSCRQASAVLPDQHQELGRKAERQVRWYLHSPFLTFPTWKDISCLIPSVALDRCEPAAQQLRLLKMEQADSRTGETVV